MHIRELAEDDLLPLLDLCRRTLPFDEISWPMLRRRVLDEPERNARYQLMAWDGNRLAGALLGGTRVIDQSRVAWVRLVTVDPAYRRQGLASRLLEELESRLRADGLTRLAVANSMPAYFWPGVDL